MRLVFVHFRAAMVELIRYPSFSLPTLLLPAVFFLAFGVPYGGAHPNELMASFAAFALMGVAFFQFGVGIAIERVSPWQLFLRTLPASGRVRFAARLLSALAFGASAAAAVILVAVAVTDVDLGITSWARFSIGLLAGSIPFGLTGIALGYWLTPKGALPGANLLYLGLAYAGGLWTGARNLPGAVDAVSPHLPTRQWGEVLWPAVRGDPWPLGAWIWLGCYSAVVGAVAAWGYRRDEGERFA